jgi:hypothetical protein
MVAAAASMLFASPGQDASLTAGREIASRAGAFDANKGTNAAP